MGEVVSKVFAALALTIGLLLLLGSGCCFVKKVPVTKQTAAERAMECTVSIVTVSPAGNPVTGGTGVILKNKPGSPMKILTAYHVVRNVGLNGNTLVVTENGVSFKESAVMSKKEKADLAILETTEPAKGGCEVSLGPEASVGQGVMSTGYPPMQQKQILSGTVMALVMESGMRQYLHDSSIVHGWSGGGLWNKRGELIGINRATKMVVVIGPLGLVRIVSEPRSLALHTKEMLLFLGGK